MRNSWRNPVLAVVGVFAFGPWLLAQTNPTGDGRFTPELAGVWVKVRGPEGNFRFSLEEPPLQPWALEIYRRNRAGVRNPAEQGLDDLDPNSYCHPPGATRAMIGYPFEIIQLPRKVVVLFEVSNGVRQIYTDGRRHPDGWPFGWMGHSVGTYEGDALVVDTVGLNDRAWLDRAGTPHSDALHVVERFRRTDPRTMEVEFLFEDPKTFTRPWRAKQVYQLRANMEILSWITCEDHLQIGKYWMHEPDKP